MRKKSGTTRRKLPVARTDRAAEAFVGRADLTRYDLSGLQPVRFEFAPKSARLNMPGSALPRSQLAPRFFFQSTSLPFSCRASTRASTNSRSESRFR